MVVSEYGFGAMGDRWKKVVTFERASPGTRGSRVPHRLGN